MKKQYRALGLMLAFFALIALPSAAQTQPQTDKAKSTMKSAATDTKTAAKDVSTTTKSGTMAATNKATAKTEKAPAQIDINSASKDELMKLEGVGDAIAAKIIAGRPYHTKRDLLTRKIVNQPTYNKISEKIIAHGGFKASAPAKKK